MLCRVGCIKIRANRNDPTYYQLVATTRDESVEESLEKATLGKLTLSSVSLSFSEHTFTSVGSLDLLSGILSGN